MVVAGKVLSTLRRDAQRARDHPALQKREAPLLGHVPSIRIFLDVASKAAPANTHRLHQVPHEQTFRGWLIFCYTESMPCIVSKLLPRYLVLPVGKRKLKRRMSVKRG